MSKISLIIKREYITRVRKRSFIIMSIIGPILFAAFMIVPSWLATLEDSGVQTIAIVEYNSDNEPVADSLQFFRNIITNTDKLYFMYLSSTSLEDVLKTFDSSPFDGILLLHHSLLITSSKASVKYYAKKQPSLGVQTHITKSLENYIKNIKLIKHNIPPDLLKSLQTKVDMQTIKVEKGGFRKEESLNIKRGIGLSSAFLLYFFILFFGSRVMRGIAEEKINRVLEVIITSVKPFQLMMGKIIGIGLVGLTQFAAWIILTIAISGFAQQMLFADMQQPKVEELTPENFFESNTVQPQMQMAQSNKAEVFTFLTRLKGVDFFVVLGAFLFYFLGGFLLYGSLFAAIGAIVDTDTDTQQFTFPVTIPLVISIVVMMNAIMNPEGQIALWFSLIPFTSPVVMMARIPFGVPYIQVIISILLLVATFVASVWIAGKIYRTGILMYGKRITYRELWKWIRYRK